MSNTPNGTGSGTGGGNDNSNNDGDTPLPYDRWVEDALRSVVRRTLDYIVANGLPGEHHCYITFHTTHPGAHVPGPLRAQHPDTMTIVLQYQFDDLEVAEDHFAVTLRFGGKPERLVVPMAAITAFHDPAVNFGLQLNVRELAAAAAESAEIMDVDDPDVMATFAPTGDADAPSATSSSAAADDDDDGDEEEEKTGEVITLDQFRKK